MERDRVGITLDDQRTDLLVEYILWLNESISSQVSDIAEYATKLYVEKFKAQVKKYKKNDLGTAAKY